MIKNRRIIIIALLTVYTFYIPITHRVDISLGIIVLGTIGILDILSSYESRINRYIIIYFLLTLSMAFPIMYSSDYTQGLLYTTKNLLSLFFVSAGFRVCKVKKDEILLKTILWVSLPLLICNIIFARNNALELKFANSLIAHFLIAPTSLVNLYGSNITDPNKAGTIFLNTNNASVFFCTIFAICLVVCKKKNEKIEKKYLVLAIICASSILSTGCRIGMIVLFLEILCFAFLKKKEILIKIALSIGILALLVLILKNINIPYVSNTISRLSWSIIKNDPRMVLWSFALKNLNFFGYGYGGWEELVLDLPAYYQKFPPHNHLLIFLFIGGFFPAALYTLFWGSVVKKAYRAYTLYNSSYSLLLIMITINVVIHGFFDNYFLGQNNIMQLVFLLVGISIYKIQKKD